MTTLLVGVFDRVPCREACFLDKRVKLLAVLTYKKGQKVNLGTNIYLSKFFQCAQMLQIFSGIQAPRDSDQASDSLKGKKDSCELIKWSDSVQRNFILRI